MSKRLSAHFVGALIFALLCAPTFSFACMWVNGTTLDGLPHSYSPIGRNGRLERAMNETPKERMEALRSSNQYAAEKSSEEELRAVEAMLSGNPQEAVSLLREIERTTPGIYSTAVNLGTAYELAGDNENALKWITEGMARNPDSHQRTEWLHQRILETKIRLAADPQYLVSHRIISLPEKFSSDTQVKVGGTEYQVKDIAWAIDYQLTERMVFVKPPDPVVADLLFTLAQIEAHTGVVETALPLLEKAKRYGFADPALLQQITGQYQSVIFRGKVYKYTAGILLVSVFFGGLYFLYRKKVFFLSRVDYLKHREAMAARGRK